MPGPSRTRAVCTGRTPRSSAFLPDFRPARDNFHATPFGRLSGVFCPVPIGLIVRLLRLLLLESLCRSHNLAYISPRHGSVSRLHDVHPVDFCRRYSFANQYIKLIAFHRSTFLNEMFRIHSMCFFIWLMIFTGVLWHENDGRIKNSLL